MNNLLNFIKRNWYYFAAAIVLLIVIVVVRKKRKNNNIVDTTDPATVITDDPGKISGTGELPEATYPLRPYSVVGSYSASEGSYGKQIQRLQQIYNANITQGQPLDTDGKYGPKTSGAFKGFFYDMIGGDGSITKSNYLGILQRFGK